MVKILVDGLMHVGDILIASSVLPVLKKAYPESQITYLTESLRGGADARGCR